jgi:hypothetical protein
VLLKQRNVFVDRGTLAGVDDLPMIALHMFFLCVSRYSHVRTSRRLGI